MLQYLQPPFPTDPELLLRQQHEYQKPDLHAAWSYHFGWYASRRNVHTL